MFEGFEGGGDRQSRRRFAVSSGASISVCVLVIAVIIGLASRPRPKRAKPPPVKVVFHAPVKRPPPPPAPKPKPRPKRAAAKMARKAAGPSAAPTQRPAGALPEADASHFQGTTAGIAWGEEGTTGLGGGALGDERRSVPPPPPPALRGIGVRPENVAERMTPPRPDPANRLPAYPDDMRKKGVESLVILRVLIDEQGRVKHVDVVQGEEPFLGAALDAVKNYRYEPALLDGRPAAVHRLLRLPFRLRA
ncbi:MAG TPA: energy transducer TonB [Kofleriaceae bacterium]|nr:energy transducer TonB [Kofleriaceae bacterium]